MSANITVQPQKESHYVCIRLADQLNGAVCPLPLKASPERSEEKKIDVRAMHVKFVKANTLTAKPIRLWYKVTKKISADKNISIGIDVHLRTWSVTELTPLFCALILKRLRPKSSLNI